MILQILQILLVSLFGINNHEPVHDLRKKPTREDHIRKIDCFVKRYYGFCIAVMLIAMFIVLVVVAVMSVGPSAVDSGLVYNHMDKII